jgi:hypothetical protein
MFKNFALILGVLLCVTLSNCRKPLDGIDLTVSMDNIRTVSIWVGNANPQSSNLYPANARVSFSGPDAERIRSLNSSAPLVIKDGYLVLRAGNGEVKTSLDFSVKAEAPGYISSTKAVHYNGEQDLQVRFNLVELANLPNGVSAVEADIIPAANGEVQQLTISTPLVGKQEKAVMTIKAGSVFKKANGALITEPVHITLVHFDDRNDESLLSIPSDGLTPDKIFENGVGSINTATHPLGAVYLDISSKGEPVAGISKPVDIKVELNPDATNLFNPLLQILPGDRLVVIGNEPGLSSWTAQQNSTVSNETTATFNVTSFSTQSWVLTTKSNFCTNTFNLTVESNLTDGVNQHLVEIVNSKNNSLVASGLFTIGNNSVIAIQKLPKISYFIRVWMDATRSEKIGESLVFSNCPNAGKVKITVPLPTMIFDIVSRCTLKKDVNGNQVTYRYSGTLYFRPFPTPGQSTAWRTLGVAVNGVLETNKLEFGKEYDFLATLPQGLNSDLPLTRRKTVVRTDFITVNNRLNTFQYRPGSTNIIPNSICLQIP